MSKAKKKTSKVLVRNPSVPIRSNKAVEKTHGLRKVHFVEDPKPEPDHPRLLSPEFCTLLQVADEMKCVRSAQNAGKPLPEGTKYRNLNFLPEEKIYQDLVALEISEEQPMSEIKSQSSRASLKKDPEPDFDKYLTYTLQPEYYFTPEAVPVLRKQKPVFDGCLIFNKMRIWRDQVDC